MKTLLLIALLGCTTVHTPPPTTSLRQQIANRDIGWHRDTIVLVRFNPPPVHLMYRLQMEACTGRTRDGWPALYVSGREVLYVGGGLPAAAFYDPTANAIVFSLGAEMAPWVARHEYLHFLLHPIGGHPVEWFGPDSPCADLLRPGGA